MKSFLPTESQPVFHPNTVLQDLHLEELFMSDYFILTCLSPPSLGTPVPFPLFPTQITSHTPKRGQKQPQTMNLTSIDKHLGLPRSTFVPTMRLAAHRTTTKTTTSLRKRACSHASRTTPRWSSLQATKFSVCHN